MKERLTERTKNGVKYETEQYVITCYPENNNLNKVDKLAVKLCEYEDAEENGTLIKLPCKVGDTVYLVIEDEIFEWQVQSIEIFDFDTVLRLGHKGTCDYAAEYISSLNDRLFITYKAAEKRLEELKG